MAPQDDLTAERAARIYAKLGRGSMPDIRTIGEALKTARQEALREAASVVLDFMEQARQQDLSGGYTSELIVRALDRLASEGG